MEKDGKMRSSRILKTNPQDDSVVVLDEILTRERTAQDDACDVR